MKRNLYRMAVFLLSAGLLGGCDLFGGADEKEITLRLSEISCTYHQDVPVFIEVFNYGREPVDLETLTLRSTATVLGSRKLFTGTFSLPDYQVPPGAYILLRSRVDDALADDPGSGIFYLAEGDYFPCWTNMGFAELVYKGQSVDFVRWGSSGVASPLNGTFESSAPGTAFASYSYGRSIIRSMIMTDTDSGLDWKSVNPYTPRGPNEPAAYTDGDGDGLPDKCEELGTAYGGVSYYNRGARTDQKDLFVHISFLDRPALRPREEALKLVAGAFAANGYTLHFDAGTLFDSSALNPARWNLSGLSHEIPYRATGVSSLHELKAAHFPVERRPGFHYLLMGSTLGDEGTYGAAELGGNDLLCTLEEMTFSTEEQIIQVQAAVIMHLLGHNLGLSHGSGYLGEGGLTADYRFDGTFAMDGDGSDDWGQISLPFYRDWTPFDPDFPSGAGDPYVMDGSFSFMLDDRQTVITETSGW